jgi:hypothetical protein
VHCLAASEQLAVLSSAEYVVRHLFFFFFSPSRKHKAVFASESAVNEWDNAVTTFIMMFRPSIIFFSWASLFLVAFLFVSFLTSFINIGYYIT